MKKVSTKLFLPQGITNEGARTDCSMPERCCMYVFHLMCQFGLRYGEVLGVKMDVLENIISPNGSGR